MSAEEVSTLFDHTELAAWLGGVSDALGDPLHVVGHSMGSFIGLEAAATFSDRIASLVLMGLGASMPVQPDLQTSA